MDKYINCYENLNELILADSINAEAHSPEDRFYFEIRSQDFFSYKHKVMMYI